MARILIVGCGGRGRALARDLLAEGHAVRGTTRRPDGVEELRGIGVEPWVADPDRVGTLVPAFQGVAVVVHLLASANGSDDALVALHGPRLEALLAKVVDTGVRGFVYEARGTVAPATLAGGVAIARRAAQTWQIPLELLDADPSESDWPPAAHAAVARLLAGAPPSAQATPGVPDRRSR